MFRDYTESFGNLEESSIHLLDATNPVRLWPRRTFRV